MKIKLMFVAAMSILMTIAARAEVLTPDAALQRAGVGSNSRLRSLTQSQMRLVRTFEAENAPAVYTFASPNGGWMVLAADDAVAPVLGYSTTGDLFSEEIPENMRSWLQGYADQIAYVRSKGLTSADMPEYTPDARASIAPLVTTLWNQDEPYNNMCPVDPNSSRGWKCVTGCVATAMAQVIRWHEWPVQGTGYHSYVWNEQSLGFDFGNTTFDYANMLDDYVATPGTDVQNDAVATLMSACGISIDMQYSASSSGAFGKDVPVPLWKYFNYDEHINWADRLYFSGRQWDELVYDQLAKVGPVLFNGTSTAGGHEFVVDGYSSDGFFHLNWGWGGKSDGYFLLSTLNPYEQGIGGGSNSGFTYNQGAVCGMSPTYIAGQYGSVWRGTTAVVLSTTTPVKGEQFTAKVTVDNRCFKKLGYTGALALVDANGVMQVLEETTFAELDYDKTLAVTIPATLPANLDNGTYTMMVMSKEDDGQWHRLPINQKEVSEFTVTVEGDNVTITKNAPTAPKKNVVLKSIRLIDKPVIRQPFRLELTIENPQDAPWELPFFVGLTYPEGHEVTGIIYTTDDLHLTFEGNETKTYVWDADIQTIWNLSGEVPFEAGEYRLAAYTYSSMFVSMGAYSRMGDFQPITFYGPDPTSFALPASVDVTLGESRKINPIVTPDYADTSATWTSSDETIATVDADGTVHGLKLGSCTLTAVSTALGTTHTCTVNVVGQALRDMPCTINGIIYDYANEEQTELKISGVENRAVYGKTLIPEAEIDGVPVTTVGAKAFDGTYTSLRGIYLPEGYTTIEAGAFSASGTYSIYLPSTITTLSSNSLRSSMNKIFMANPNLKITGAGILKTSSNKMVYVPAMPDAPEFSNSSVYKVYERFNDLFITDEGVVCIPTSDTTADVVDCIWGGDAVTSLTVPTKANGYKLTRLNNYAFYWAYYITDFELPSTIESIGTQSFYYANKLKTFRCYIPNPTNVTVASNAFNNSTGGTLYVPTGSKEVYESLTPWSTFAAIVEFDAPSQEGIFLNPSSFVIQQGDTRTLEVSTFPVDLITEAIVWTSSNPTVATVDSEGVVTGVTEGTATISASANGFTGTAEVTVMPRASTDFPVKIGNVTYDYVDDTRSSLMVTTATKSITINTCDILDNVEGLPVVKIAPKAFMQTYYRHITLPNTIVEVGDSAFRGCSRLNTIIIPASVSKMGKNALMTTTHLRKIFCMSKVDLGFKNAGMYGSDPFTIYLSETPATMDFYEGKYQIYPELDRMYEKDGLLYIPTADGSAHIVDIVHHRAPKAIVIEEGTTAIGHYAFHENSTITSVDIPYGVTSIGMNAFYNCSKLTSVSVHADNPADIELSAEVFEKVPVASATLHVPVGCAEAYHNATQWSDFANIVDDTVSGVPGVAAETSNVSMSGRVLSSDAPFTVYDLQGRVLARNIYRYTAPSAGVYVVVVEGHNPTKVVVR